MGTTKKIKCTIPRSCSPQEYIVRIVTCNLALTLLHSVALSVLILCPSGKPQAPERHGRGQDIHSTMC